MLIVVERRETFHYYYPMGVHPPGDLTVTDVVNVDQLREMLGGIGYKAAYGLLHDGSIRFFKIGKAFRIPKINIIEYLQRNSEI